MASLEEGNERGAVLQAIFAMADALGLEAIAEGVETTGQLRQLRDLGCRWVQGFVIARPLPADRVLAFIAEQATLSSAVGGAGGLRRRRTEAPAGRRRRTEAPAD